MRTGRNLRHLALTALRYMSRVILQRSGGEEKSPYAYVRVREFDEKLPEDIEDVLELSAILEVREYDIFELAYRWWHEASPRHELIEPHFAKYMFNQVVPPWVRQYSRMVLTLRDDGKLDKEALGIALLPNATPRQIRAGVRYSVMLACILSMLVVIANLAYTFMDLPCMFPPCY